MEGIALERRGVSSGGAMADAIRAPGPGGWLLALLLAASAYAAFAGGATTVPAETRVQVGISIGALLGGLGLATGALGAARSPLAWAGVALLALFALWSVIGVSWSPGPDNGWLAANRAAAYTAAVAAALVAAPSVRAAPVAFAVGFVLVALAIAAYAVAGKVVPQLQLGPIDLDHASRFARLRAPIGYWNGLGSLLVMAAPACIWLAASDRPHPNIRVASALALQFILIAVALTYSRGAVIAYVAAVAVMVGAGPQRLGRLGIAVAAPLLAAPAVIFAFTRETLSSDRVAAAERSGDGALLALAILGSMLALAGLARVVMRWEQTAAWTPEHSRATWRALAITAALGLVAAIAAVSVSDRGLSGTASEEWRQFRAPVSAGGDPSRFISSSSSNRWIWWREAAGAASDKPVFGWGTGAFPALHNVYREYPNRVRSAHSVPLQFLAEGGIVGMGLALAGLGLLAAAAVSTIRRARGPTRDARLALLAAFAAWAVHSLYDWDWEIPGVTLPALIAVAIAAAPQAEQRRRRARAPEPDDAPGHAVPVAVVTSLLAAALVVSAVLPSLSQDHRVAAQVDDAGPKSLEPAAREAALARRLDPLSAEAFLTAAEIERERGDFERAGELTGDAVALEPFNPRAWQDLAEIATVLGDPGLAREALSGFTQSVPLQISDVRGTFAARAFLLSLPAEFSPTAYGTPPP